MARICRHADVLLQIWREACRHIEIHDSAATIARLLAPHAPLAWLVVGRINLAQSCVETVAVGAPDAARTPRVGRADCPPKQMQSLLAWCARGVALRAAELPAELRDLPPGEADEDLFVGPLTGADGPAGVLTFASRPSQPFTDDDLRLLSALCEPFSAALENDRRLHEMTRLREAAEADRSSLLRKLGRKDVATPIVGSNDGLQQVMERVAQVAASDAPVLLLGETGTGKEVVARAVHAESSRTDGPFIRVNCGAIPPELIDSQLFGHEKGSFTGAVETRKGWFERADGGTLFLDEIGDLPLAAQVRLLRVLQDGSMERVGGQNVIHVDVRVIGATHRDLAAMARTGEFRADLWYRLAVFPIPIPPLRDRVEDIGPLARHFAEKAATRFGLPLVLPDADDIRRLMEYAWPGNVRELAAVIDRAALLGDGRRLEIAKALGATSAPEALAPTDKPLTAPTASVAAPDSLDEAMRGCIEAALAHCRGRVEGPFGAAARLNINPNTLRARMRKLGVDWRQFRG